MTPQRALAAAPLAAGPLAAAALATALAAVPAAAPAKPPAPGPVPQIVSITGHRATPEARDFRVRVRGRTDAVWVCDRDGPLCVEARRRPGHWAAALPVGDAAQVHTGGGAAVGTGPTWRVTVVAFREGRMARRFASGVYR